MNIDWINIKKFLTIIAVCIPVATLNAQNRSYLLHTNDNIDRLKRQIVSDESVRKAWNEQLQKAQELIKKERLHAADCQVLGLAFRMTGEPKYAAAIKRSLLDYTGRETWEGKELLNRNPPWRGGLGTAHTSFYIALGFDCAYDYLSQPERRRIAEGLVRIGISPQREDWLLPSTRFHTFDTMGHNWWSACVYMAGFASLAIINESPEAEAWVNEIAETAPEWFSYSGSVLQNKIPTFDSDGGFYESINYASFGISQYLLFRYAFGNVFPGIKQPDLPLLEKIADFFIHTTYYVRNDRPMSVNFGDGSINRNGASCVLALWNLGYQKDRYAWYLNKVKYGAHEEGFELNTPNGLILHPDLPVLAKDFKPDLAKSRLFSDMEWAIMRNSWEDNATMLAVKSGFTWNHAHADAGSYILFHNGKNLIIDSGNSSYADPLYTEYYCQSQAHNVVLFNGQGQDPKDPYFGSVNHGSLHHLIDGRDFRYVLADATGPYSHLLRRNYRSFLWIGDVILVIDDLLAHKPGEFEWLLHYNGESERRGKELTIRDDAAEAIVYPLYPETFPDGGLPHDFPEKMRLDERLGYEDHNPGHKTPYWSIRHFQETARTKFITAIILKNEQNQRDLPEVERFERTDYLGIRIKQKGETTEVYFNLLADGRLKHRNSVISMNGWETDAYLTVLTFDNEGGSAELENLNRMFIGHGSYLRRESKTLFHALSKFFGLADLTLATPAVNIDAQAGAKISIYAPAKEDRIRMNGKVLIGAYHEDNQVVSFTYHKHEEAK